jgi:hypothetical protein
MESTAVNMCLVVGVSQSGVKACGRGYDNNIYVCRDIGVCYRLNDYFDICAICIGRISECTCEQGLQGWRTLHADIVTVNVVR